MSMSRQAVLSKILRNINLNKPIIGVSVGAGISAKYTVMGGADMIFALNSGRFRQMGFGSLAGLMPYANCNKMVLDFGYKEVLRVAQSVPVMFGLCASDPTIDLDEFIEKIYFLGFSGINNFPTVGLIDGNFRRALDASGLGYEHEVKAIQTARKKNIFSVAFVFDSEQALKMLDAGADVICVHLGITKGGTLGVKNYLPLEEAVNQARRMASSGDNVVLSPAAASFDMFNKQYTQYTEARTQWMVINRLVEIIINTICDCYKHYANFDL